MRQLRKPFRVRGDHGRQKDVRIGNGCNLHTVNRPRNSAPFHQLAVALSHTDQSYGRIGCGSQETPRTRRPCLRLDLEGAFRLLREVRHLDVSSEITEIADISARDIESNAFAEVAFDHGVAAEPDRRIARPDDHASG